MCARAVCVAAAIFVCFSSFAIAQTGQEGSLPRNLAVTSDGATVLTTSMGSNYVVQMNWDGNNWVRQQIIDVGAKSWGICLLNDNTAIVTLPFENKLVWLVRFGAGQDFQQFAGMETQTEYYNTEIISNPAGSKIFVCNRGKAPEYEYAPDVESWQHAIYEYDISGYSATPGRTFVTDREPRAMALSPNEDRLFVAHAQGALGGSGNDATVMGGDDLTDLAHPAFSTHSYDGGSVIAFDLTSAVGQPDFRIKVGSPVRDVEVLPLGSTYRIYYVHVGFGAQAEDPGFGGQKIPNLISTIEFDGTAHTPLGTRQDILFDHDPEVDDLSTAVAVLHEQIAIREKMGEPTTLWVSNSASGTVSRAELNTDGTLKDDGGPQANLSVFHGLSPRIDPDNPRNATNKWIRSANIIADDPLGPFDKIFPLNPNHFPVGALEASGNFVFSSNPRGIVYDASSYDRILTVTHFDQQLVDIDLSLVDTDPVGAVTRYDLTDHQFPLTIVGAAKRNFFTFGQGFNFREILLGEPQVNTISCGTCHVEGHLDGKVRFIVRDTDNVNQPLDPNIGTLSLSGEPVLGGTKFAKPVTVPSIFDAGHTEWLFHEGLKTVRDDEAQHIDDCEYCGRNGFFDDTFNFTTTVASPMSPYTPQRYLQGASLRGRLYFEAMNCSRCHAGPTGQFRRTNEPAVVDQLGPLPGELMSINRFLHDPAQSFITFINIPDPQGAPSDGEIAEAQAAMAPCPREGGRDNASFRNMSDVGTRALNDGGKNGINTPALAGAWDNRPYMHDGRYRTLDDVLMNTWIFNDELNDDVDEHKRAATLVQSGVPDNALDLSPLSDDLTECIASLPATTDLFTFVTHKNTAMISGRESVHSYLNGLSSQAYQDLVAFLRSLSSETELCDEPTIGYDLITDISASFDGANTTVSWNSTVPIDFDVMWGPSGIPGTPAPPPAPPYNDHGTSHYRMITTGRGCFQVDITARMRTICGSDLTVSYLWSTGDQTATLSANSTALVCPGPDTLHTLGSNALVITLDDVDTGEDPLPPWIFASRFSVAISNGSGVRIFDAETSADTDATPPEYQTTITLDEIGGCSRPNPETGFGVLLDGSCSLGEVFVDVRSADMVKPIGIVDMLDFDEFSKHYPSTYPSPEYDRCADLDFNGEVSAADLSTFALHMGHQTSGGGGSPTSAYDDLIASNASLYIGSPTASMYENASAGGANRLQAEIELYDLDEIKSVLVELEVGGSIGAAPTFVADARVRTVIARAPEGFSSNTVYLAAWNLDRVGNDLRLGTLTLDLEEGPESGSSTPRVRFKRGWVLTSSGLTRRLGEAAERRDPQPTAVLANWIGQNRPNPFNPVTTIEFSVAQDGHVGLEVFNAAGQRVRTLFDRFAVRGPYKVVWDGRDNQGNRVASGIYFYRIHNDVFTETKKMVLLK